MISNYMEIVVKDTLSDLLKDQEIKCDCDECIADIEAITLNNLKPTI